MVRKQVQVHLANSGVLDLCMAHAVLASFSGVPASIQQWCCSQEEHQLSTGKHYHMAIKFDKNQQWLSSKRYLLKNNGTSIHFSAVHNDYYSAWKYATKEDKDALESDDHPDLTNTTKSPRTTEASKKQSSRAKAGAVNTRLTYSKVNEAVRVKTMAKDASISQLLRYQK